MKPILRNYKYKIKPYDYSNDINLNIRNKTNSVIYHTIKNNIKQEHSIIFNELFELTSHQTMSNHWFYTLAKSSYF